jgi:5S rRNA maturation endonuclease (ribonuclease M5)
MNLIEELRRRGHHLKQEGSGNYRVVGHGGLIVKDNAWYSHSQGIGGNATTLLDQIGNAYDSKGKIVSGTLTTRRLNSRAPLESELYPLGWRAREYLMLRHIHGELIDELNENGTLREDRKGYICFVGYDASNKVRCVTCRAMEPHYWVQKYEKSGSRKQYTFSIPAQKTSDIVILCEGPIDALSIACLEDLKHFSGYFNTTKIATCGAPPAQIVTRVKRLHPKKLILAFDNDIVGDRMAKSVALMFKYSQIELLKAKPGKGHDPNVWLQNYMKELSPHYV